MNSPYITRIDKQGSFYYPEQLGSVLKTKVESYVTALVYKVGNRIFGVITARAERSDTPPSYAVGTTGIKTLLKRHH